MTELICKHCNQPFDLKARGRRNNQYCSDACRHAHYALAKQIGLRVLRGELRIHPDDLPTLPDRG